MHALVEDHRGIFAVGHAERLGTCEPRQRDLARRLPRLGVRLFPAIMPPPRPRVERRPLVVTDPEQGSDAAVGHCGSPVFLRAARNRYANGVMSSVSADDTYTGGSSAAATSRSSASSTL